MITCQSTNTASMWHNWVGSQTTMRSIGYETLQTMNGWTTTSFDDSSWVQPCTSTSGFSLKEPAPTGYAAAKKIWGRGKFSYFRSIPSASTLVTCHLTVDNNLEIFAYNGVELQAGSDPDFATSKNDWTKTKKISFVEVEGAILAVKAKDMDATTGAATCGTGGLLMTCQASNTASKWHNWVASATTMRSVGHPSDQAIVGWTMNNFDDSSWKQPCTSTSGFKMNNPPAASATPPKIWGSDKFSFFRSVP